MRRIILFLFFLFTLPLASAVLEGFLVTDIFLENFTLGPNGGVYGPLYLMSSAENSTGAMYVEVTPVDPHGGQAVISGVVDSNVGTFNMTASSEGITFHTSNIRLYSLVDPDAPLEQDEMVSVTLADEEF